MLLLDKVLRISAIATVVVSAPIVLIMGAFATDSGTIMATTVGLGILVVGGLIGLLVIIASLKFRRAAAREAPPHRNQSPLLSAIVYLVGTAGLFAAGTFAATKWRDVHRSQSVLSGTAVAPILNPQPQWMLRIGGELPATVPLQYLEAHYVTDTIKNTLQGKCPATRGPITQQLIYSERIDVTRDAGRYTAIVAVDRFHAGICGWHLSTIDFKILGRERSFQPGQINVYDPRFNMLGPIPAVRQAKYDLWCGDAGCDTVARARPDLNDALPPEKRDWSVSFWIYRDTPLAEVDFHHL